MNRTPNLVVGRRVPAASSILTGGAINALENSTAVVTVRTMTASPTFSITGGADQAKFNINSSTGAITFKSAPDYETPGDANADNIYEVTVSDGTLSQTFYITVHDATANSIINGTFEADTDWTKGTGWTIAGGKAIATNVGAGALTAAVAPLTVGLSYIVTYTLVITSGDVYVACGTTNGTIRSTSGTFTETLTCAGSGAFAFKSDAGGFNGTIDVVSAVRT